MGNPLDSRWCKGSLMYAPPTIVGTAYFVDATNGASTNTGLDWSNALITIDAAINKCTADKGDVIYVAPWHVENLTAVTDIVMDTAGVSIIGMTDGTRIPILTVTVAAGNIAVSAANCRISGLCFVSACVDGMTTGAITGAATADGLVVDNCIFRDGGTDVLEMVYGIYLTAGCNDCRITDNRFYTTDAGSGTLAGICLAGESARTVIANNILHGDWNSAGILGSAALQTNILIADNYIYNTDSAAGLAISLNAASTGAVVRNLVFGGKNTTAPVSAAACLAAENYATTVITESGNLCPAVDS